MQPIKLTINGVQNSRAAPMDTYQNPFNVGIGAVTDGTVDYTIQHTFDDVFNSSVTPTWFDHPTLVSQIAEADGNYAFPVRAIRVIGNVGSTGAVTVTLIQAGMPGR